MGAWGYGILQNDTAQDGLADIINVVQADLVALAKKRPDETGAARVGAAVGVLLHLSSWYSFDPEKETNAKILAAIERQQPKFGVLPRPAIKLLSTVLEGKGSDLANRPGKMSKSLQRALFATDSDGFPMERVFGKREPSLFAHPKAARYVQELANWCVERVDEDFEEEFVIEDLSGEGEGMGAFSTLLVLEPCRVSVRKIEKWRKTYRQVRDDPENEMEEDYYAEFDKCLELAFRLMLKKFATK